MCVCMYVCVYVCVRTHLRMYVCMYVCGISSPFLILPSIDHRQRYFPALVRGLGEASMTSVAIIFLILPRIDHQHLAN